MPTNCIQLKTCQPKFNNKRKTQKQKRTFNVFEIQSVLELSLEESSMANFQQQRKIKKNTNEER